MAYLSPEQFLYTSLAPYSQPALEEQRQKRIAKARGKRNGFFIALERAVGSRVFTSADLPPLPQAQSRIRHLVERGYVRRISEVRKPGQWPWVEYQIIPENQRNARKVEQIERDYQQRLLQPSPRQVALRTALQIALEHTTDARRDFILRRLLTGGTARAIAKDLGISPERVRQLKAGTLNATREHWLVAAEQAYQQALDAIADPLRAARIRKRIARTLRKRKRCAPRHPTKEKRRRWDFHLRRPRSAERRALLKLTKMLLRLRRGGKEGCLPIGETW